MYHLVQQFAAHGTVEPIPGRVISYPAVVEDPDAARYLLIDASGSVLHAFFDEAVRLGAEWVVRVRTGTLHDAVPMDVYERTHTHNVFSGHHDMPANTAWLPLPGGTLDRIAMTRAYAARPVLANPFVHLHTHTEMSPYDGLTTMEELMGAVTADGQSAVAVTDHGYVTGHPGLQKAALAAGVNPIFGIEAYFVPDRHVREDQFDYSHLVLWAMDEQGLHNLWAMSTESFRDGFYGKPRLDWDTLSRLNTGVLASTACLGGPLLKPYTAGNPQLALANLHRLGDLFGDRLYIELHTTQTPEQRLGNDWLVQIAHNYSIPLVAVTDSHYARPEHKDDHQAWLAMNSSGGETKAFSSGDDYHVMSAAQVRAHLAYLGADVAEQAIAATADVAARCTARIVPKVSMPMFTRASAQFPTPAARQKEDARRMLATCIANWKDRVPAQDAAAHLDRFEFESQLLVDKKFPGYYLMTADMVTYAKNHGVLVGPGRGSSSASEVAFLMQITEIDPIKHDLLFARFMTAGRTNLPDFDLDFPTSRSDFMVQYVQQRWGPDHVAQVGTHLRMKNKSAFRDVQRALRDRLPPDSFHQVTLINRIVDEAESSTAGLGLTLEQLMIDSGDLLAPFEAAMPELFALVRRFRGRLKTYGTHAAGVIIDPDESLADSLPMRRLEGGTGPMVTQFDMEALDYLGKIKFDMLKLRNLDTIQDTVDLIRASTGDAIDIYRWREEYEDPEVYSELSAGRTLGVFQLETSLGTRTTKALQPTSIDELGDVIALGRPGPMRSGLDKLYLARRSGTETVSYPDPRLEAILSRTHGIMLYQEDVMAICTVLAGYNDDEADHVRKILGKKQVSEAETEGRKFVAMAVATGTDKQVAVDLWSQMSEFTRYGFNKSHAIAYATLGYFTAWLKTHYPQYYLTASLTTIKAERIPQFVSEARRLGYRVLPPDINLSGATFTQHDLDIRYGFAAVSGIGQASAAAIIENQPYESWEDFLARKGSAAHAGIARKLARCGAFDSMHYNRRDLEMRLDDIANGDALKCVDFDQTVNNVNALPCRFDWSSEPIKLGRTGKPLKTQLHPPARCTRSCRHYRQRELRTYPQVPPYTEEQIRAIETELLGIAVSSSPFDRLGEHVLTQTITADDLVTAEFGTHTLAVMVVTARPDPKGRDFGFVTLSTPGGECDAIVFSRQWAQYRSKELSPGTMALVQVAKTERGNQLQVMRTI